VPKKLENTSKQSINCWRSAFKRAAFVELGCIALSMAGFGIFGGADNPIPFYCLLALHFPSSCLILLMLKYALISTVHGLLAYIFVFGSIVLSQTLLLATWFRQPWKGAQAS
jgi:hypothetical protein